MTHKHRQKRKHATIAIKHPTNDELGKYILKDSAFVCQFGLATLIKARQGQGDLTNMSNMPTPSKPPSAAVQVPWCTCHFGHTPVVNTMHQTGML